MHILLPSDTRLRRVAIAISLSPRPFAYFFFYSFPSPLLSPQLLARYFLRLFRTNDDEGTFRGPPTIYSAHVALSYRFHEISDTDKLSIRSSKSRGGQFSLMAAV